MAGGGGEERTHCWTWRKGSSPFAEDIILSYNGGCGVIRQAFICWVTRSIVESKDSFELSLYCCYPRISTQGRG